jgi:hypothetical protein
MPPAVELNGRRYWDGRRVLQAVRIARSARDRKTAA